MPVIDELTRLNPTQDILINPNDLEYDFTPGEDLNIYEDPFFSNQLEGIGTLVKRLASSEQQELWLVTLSSNGMTVNRWIKKILLPAV